VTHLTYQAEGTTRQPAGYFPGADFEAELLPFRRDLPPSSRDVRRHQ
jgi:pilus assembly protein CpaF